MVCKTVDCYYGFDTLTNPQAGEIAGSYRNFIEAFSFIIFAFGVTLNTGVLTVFISTYPNIESFDVFLMNLLFGELLSSFGLAFLFFVEFTTSIASIGNDGCRFLTWLDLTSVTISITAIIALYFVLHKNIYKGSGHISHGKKFGCVLVTWILASIPGLPYMATASMVGQYCRISNWTYDAELMYICFMIIFQIVVPIGVVVYFAVHMLLALRMSVVGGSILNSASETPVSSNPGSEYTFQRSILLRKFRFLAALSITYFVLLILASFSQFALFLNINKINAHRSTNAQIREFASLILCLKSVLSPLICLCMYDKIRDRVKRCCTRRRNQDAYNSLHYSVYQQTVSEELPASIVRSANGDSNSNGSRIDNEKQQSALHMADEELYETERDDVAILGN